MPEDADVTKSIAAAGVPPGQIPPIPTPANVQRFESFPVVLLILLHYLTCGLFSIIWLNLMHGRLPRVRPDDPSAARAVGFCFIPFFNLYWVFFSLRRLCLRVDEQRELYGLPASNLRGMATTACIFQVIPYINGLIGYTIITPIYIGLMQASINQLARRSATTEPRGTLAAAPAAPGMPGWAMALVVCGCLVPFMAVMAALLLPALARAKAKAQQISCINNMKQIGVAFRVWNDANGNQFPFNVARDKGGTLELCAPGNDGLDDNSWNHFQVMAKELYSPQILICPADSTKSPATDFAHLEAANVSYQIHSGTNVNDLNPQSILAICPIHHTVLLADGSVHPVSQSSRRKALNAPAESQ